MMTGVWTPGDGADEQRGDDDADQKRAARAKADCPMDHAGAAGQAVHFRASRGLGGIGKVSRQFLQGAIAIDHAAETDGTMRSVLDMGSGA